MNSGLIAVGGTKDFASVALWTGSLAAGGMSSAVMHKNRPVRWPHSSVWKGVPKNQGQAANSLNAEYED